MILNKKCLRCESTQNLNTSMTVVIDTVKYDIVLCDQHAEDTTPKKAKELVLKKVNEYNELISKMKEFGLTVTENSAGIAVPEKIEVPAPEQKVESQQEPTPGPKPEAKKPEQKTHVLKKAVLPAVAPKIVNQLNGISSHKSLDINGTIAQAAEIAKKKGHEVKQMPITEEYETQVVLGRGGQQMVIPKTIKDNTGGSTRITIVDTGGDRTIQHRAKAQMHDPDPHFFKSGYNVKECPMCSGTGQAKIGNNVCPKCKGAGILN